MYTSKIKKPINKLHRIDGAGPYLRPSGETKPLLIEATKRAIRSCITKLTFNVSLRARAFPVLEAAEIIVEPNIGPSLLTYLGVALLCVCLH